MEIFLSKASALFELVARRRSETYPAYHHLHSFDEGIWDCEHGVPWTKSACNLDAGLMIICLGAKTFNSARRALKLPDLQLKDAYVPSAHTIYHGSEIYGVPHTGGLGHANAGGMEKVDQIWAGLATRFDELYKRSSKNTA